MTPSPQQEQTPTAPPPVMTSDQIMQHVDSVYQGLPDPVKQALDHAHTLTGGAPTTTIADATQPSPFRSLGEVAGGRDQAASLLAKPATPSPMMTATAPPPVTEATTPPSASPEAPLPLTTAPKPMATAANVPGVSHAQQLEYLHNSGGGISHIHNPFLRGLATVGDAIGSGLFPQLTRFIPGFTAHNMQLQQNERQAIGEEQGAAKSAADVAREEAQTKLENQQADTLAAEGKRAPKGNYITVGDGLYNASTGAWEREPTDKDKEKLVAIDPEFAAAHHITASPDGKFYIPQAAVGELFKEPKTPTNEMEKFFTDNPKATSEDWEKFKAAHPKPMEWSATDAAILRAVGGDPSKAETQTFDVMKKFADLKKEHIAVGADHGVSFVDPQTHKLVRVEPGGTVPEGGVTPQQSGQQNLPTMQMRNVAAQSQLVHEQMPEVIGSIDKLKDQLGPVAGRWNEFMQGKVGMDNPDMAALRADLLMMSSAVALMHARGRLPENLREEFDHAINAPKQTAENLKATLRKIDDWTVKNAKAMGVVGPKTPAETLPGGITIDDVNKEIERRKAGKK